MYVRAICALLASGLFAPAARATFHFMQIEQVIGGVNGDTTVQAIQLRQRFAGQNLVSQSRVVVRDAQGLNPIIVLNIAANVPNGAAGARILLATANISNFTSPPLTPDFTITNPIPPSYMAAGTLTFESDTGIIYWRLSWGGANYTGPGNGAIDNDADGNFNPPFPGPLPTCTTQALQFRFGAAAASTNNANDYQITPGSALLVRNNGQSGTVTAPPGPTGACCAAGTCQVTSSASCACLGGAYQGDGSTCSPNPCPQPPQACCLPNGNCFDLDADTCVSQGGSPQGAGTSCGGVSCPQPQEACCFPNGSCNTIDPTNCTNSGGQPGGHGSACQGDANGNGTDDFCEVPATLVGAVSRKNCDLVVNLVEPISSEPRRDGITQLIFRYDGPPPPGEPVIQEATCAGGGVPQPYSGASVPNCLPVENDLSCTFSPGLENARTYYFTVPSGQSNANVVLRGLLGDVNSDGQVNGLDRSTVLAAWTGPGFSCATDVSNDNVTNGLDRSIVIAAWTGAQNCAPGQVKKCPPGRDCFRTAPCGSTQTKQSFEPTPIPAGFFDTGSDEFTGEIVFEGVPLDPATLGDADTCMLRLEPLVFPTVPSSSTSGIIIEQLRLRSASPITVTYSNGNPPEAWDVEVDLSPTGAPVGSLTANKTHDNGGTFSATFYVLPRFTFTRQSDLLVRVLDTGDPGFGMPPIEFSTPDPDLPPECGGPSWVQSLGNNLMGLVVTSPCFVPGVAQTGGRGVFEVVSICHGASCFGVACPAVPDAHCVEPPMETSP